MSGSVEGVEVESWWFPHDGETTFRWSRTTAADGTTGPWRLSGMTLYGEISAARLQAIRLTGERGPRLTTFARSEASPYPHTEEHLRALVGAESNFDPSAWRVNVQWTPRTESESAEDFYLRVAQAFEALQPNRPRDTTKALAELTDVPFTKAVHWVRKAREFGFLARSDRQLKGQSNG